ncbi:hypothetical protein LPH44_09175 [Xylella taiwanensis]|uniref:Uncharacterized protein n=1 Tax=Xylella taiwanensis TaxID=1444770 RepID=A0ABS8TVB1_9GAMM|nr:hypothetical protein [Xylella taiwanensis]MCD8457198.1 hypothetical protein [Xylella taiwanensis]MCD8459607.1 hypothetical protein [Xylella taiwanensis]MCD8461526.1 hypothetical protein [Xylella taiwanensis]MCD8462448.1 hypothetical protein [Xylella taiwanensis]MCD8466231.1 hypothetical protein [Xylella taiwanensis]
MSKRVAMCRSASVQYTPLRHMDPQRWLREFGLRNTLHAWMAFKTIRRHPTTFSFDACGTRTYEKIKHCAALAAVFTHDGLDPF